MLGWVWRLYAKRLRRLDVEVLWPELKAAAANIDEARMAFEDHAIRDPAWLVLSMDEIDRIIAALE
jgi:hypothetical protein